MIYTVCHNYVFIARFIFDTAQEEWCIAFLVDRPCQKSPIIDYLATLNPKVTLELLKRPLN